MEGKAPLLQVKSHLHHLAVVELKGSLLKKQNKKQLTEQMHLASQLNLSVFLCYYTILDWHCGAVVTNLA